jgi:hypothetical protein
LAQGRNSSNGDAIALGMEKRYWPKDRVTLRNNLILLERSGVNRLLHLRNEKAQVEVVNNVIVSARPTEYDGDNIRFASREEAWLPKYPALPIARFVRKN